MQLEIELQGKLDSPGRKRSGGHAKWCERPTGGIKAKKVSSWSIRANRVRVGELRVYVVPNIKELGAELEAAGFRKGKILEQ